MSGRTVGIIVNDVVDPFYAYIARGVEREATRGDRLSLVCCTQGDPQRELAFVELMHERRADAVIVVGGSVADRAYTAELARRARELDSDDSKLVLCGRPRLGDDVALGDGGDDDWRAPTTGTVRLGTHIVVRDSVAPARRPTVGE
ncbi:hypothetical protein [Streptomyces sp. PKU-EA00015]|uniref:hypothetical protein n=1 Tax=Streptomyces sp. PKU-EA00015 TaxID=2748326 RepID=UPI0021095199